MEIVTLGTEEVMDIHDEVLSRSGGLPGLGGNRHLDAALKRIENEIHYGNVTDIYEMAALYAVAIAQGHVFNDGNKRTAMITMVNFLLFNKIDLNLTNDEIEEMMIDIAEKRIITKEVAAILRHSVLQTYK